MSEYYNYYSEVLKKTPNDTLREVLLLYLKTLENIFAEILRIDEDNSLYNKNKQRLNESPYSDTFSEQNVKPFPSAVTKLNLKGKGPGEQIWDPEAIEKHLKNIRKMGHRDCYSAFVGKKKQYRQGEKLSLPELVCEDMLLVTEYLKYVGSTTLGFFEEICQYYDIEHYNIEGTWNGKYVKTIDDVVLCLRKKYASLGLVNQDETDSIKELRLRFKNKGFLVTPPGSRIGGLFPQGSSISVPLKKWSKISSGSELKSFKMYLWRHTQDLFVKYEILRNGINETSMMKAPPCFTVMYVKIIKGDNVIFFPCFGNAGNYDEKTAKKQLLQLGITEAIIDNRDMTSHHRLVNLRSKPYRTDGTLLKQIAERVKLLNEMDSWRTYLGLGRIPTQAKISYLTNPDVFHGVQTFKNWVRGSGVCNSCEQKILNSGIPVVDSTTKKLSNPFERLQKKQIEAIENLFRKVTFKCSTCRDLGLSLTSYIGGMDLGGGQNDLNFSTEIGNDPEKLIVRSMLILENWDSFNCAEPVCVASASMFLPQMMPDMWLSIPFEGNSQPYILGTRNKATCHHCSLSEYSFLGVSDNGYTDLHVDNIVKQMEETNELNKKNKGLNYNSLKEVFISQYNNEYIGDNFELQAKKLRNEKTSKYLNSQQLSKKKHDNFYSQIKVKTSRKIIDDLVDNLSNGASIEINSEPKTQKMVNPLQLNKVLPVDYPLRKEIGTKTISRREQLALTRTPQMPELKKTKDDKKPDFYGRSRKAYEQGDALAILFSLVRHFLKEKHNINHELAENTGSLE